MRFAEGDQYAIETLRLTKNGEVIDLSIDQVVSFDIFESMVDPFVTGRLVVRPSYGIDENLPLTGNEIIEIEFKSMGEDHPSKSVEFLVYSTEEDFVAGSINIQSRNIALMLCRRPFYKAVKNYYSRSFKSKTISSIVNEISVSMLDEALGESESSMGNIDFIMPYWNPMKTIEYLRTRGRSSISGDGGYRFFDTILYGMKFVTISGLNSKSKKLDLVPSSKQTHSEGAVLRYERSSTFDRVRAASTSLIGSRSIGFDVKNKKIYDTPLTFSEAQAKGSWLGSKAFINASDEDTSLPVLRSYENEKFYEDATITDVRDGSNEQLKIIVYMLANTSLSPGDKVWFFVPSIDTTKEENEQLSGYYLIESINTTFSDGLLKQVMILSTDAYQESEDESLLNVSNVIV